MPNRLVVEHLAKSFPSAAGELCVLQDVSLVVDGGHSVAIVGPSGSGKTTLLQILGVLDRPDAGSIRIDGEDPFALTPKRQATFRNEQIGFVFQDHHLLPQLSVLENVLVPALATGRPNDERIARAEMLIGAVGLSDRREHLPSELSGGQRERVAIARALVMKPAVVLADEPTGNLDSKTAASIAELLIKLQRDESIALVCVTHSKALADAMDQRFELVDGCLGLNRMRLG